MKDARDITFLGIADAQEAVRHLLRVRFAECLEKEHALGSGDDEAIHAFRLACKRLRYALERSPADTIDFTPIAKLLGNIAEELGAAHDCVVLAKRALDCDAALVARRALQDRGRYVRRASRMWHDAFESGGAFETLASFTGFCWSPQ